MSDAVAAPPIRCARCGAWYGATGDPAGSECELDNGRGESCGRFRVPPPPTAAELAAARAAAGETGEFRLRPPAESLRGRGQAARRGLAKRGQVDLFGGRI
jgi:hypothetical protein